MLQKAQNGQVLASMNLCRLVGLNLQTELHLQDSLTDKIDPRIWALDTSVEQRPDYTMLAQEVDLRKKQVDLTRADFFTSDRSDRRLWLWRRIAIEWR